MNEFLFTIPQWENCSVPAATYKEEINNTEDREDEISNRKYEASQTQTKQSFAGFGLSLKFLCFFFFFLI